MTALRWAILLRQLGHCVRVLEEGGSACDVLIALHARKSYPSIARSHQECPERPVIVTLTGTDLYEDVPTDAQAQQSLEWATRLVVLQRMGVEELPDRHRKKARVIYQSVRPPTWPRPQPRDDVFEVCVVGHLREVKDPFRAAEASRLLPPTSKIQILHIGSALSEDMKHRALQETERNPRYRWLGELPWEQSLKTMARCRLMVLTSRLEGGANVVCEAIACSVPILSSRISGTIGILGEDYPGFFPFGCTERLAELLTRAETDTSFYQDLKRRCDQVRHLVDPEHERASWESLLAELTFPS